MRRFGFASGLGGFVLALIARPVAAQPATARSAAAAPAAPIAILLLPLPDSLRADAGVTVRDAGGRIVSLKPTRNHLVCRRIVPGEEAFDVRCYHEAFWPVVDRMLALK